MVKVLKLGARSAEPGRAWVWTRVGRDTFVVNARQASRALKALPARERRRLLARLRANAALS